MLHQKKMVVDGGCATVGTTNLDNRAFTLNEETDVCLWQPDLVEKFRQIFIPDLSRCQKIELADWERRGLWQRTKERLAFLIEDRV
jgi:cardiolipin synthase